jgi:hypothetical protein
VTIKEETAERAKRIAAALIEATAARRRSEVDVRIPRAREKTETPGQVMDLAGHQGRNVLAARSGDRRRRRVAVASTQRRSEEAEICRAKVELVQR